MHGLIDLSFARSGGASRTLAITIYPLLVALSAMQLINPGTIERIAQQDAGRVLFGALAAFLLLSATFALVSVLGQRWSETGDLAGVAAGDALLHASIAVVYLEFSVGDLLLHAQLRALIIGSFGLLLIGTGCYLMALGIRALRKVGTAAAAVIRRDRIARGFIFFVLGSLFFVAAMTSGGVAGREVLATAWGLPILLAILAALLGYVFHTLWLIREESRAWAR